MLTNVFQANKVALQKLVTAYDGFKSQERSYMEILEKIAILQHSSPKDQTEASKVSSAKDQQDSAGVPSSSSSNDVAENEEEMERKINEVSDEGEEISRGIEDQLTALHQQKELLQTMLRQQEEVSFGNISGL